VHQLKFSMNDGKEKLIKSNQSYVGQTQLLFSH